MKKTLKDRLVDGATHAAQRTTYHSADGKFSSPLAAVIANRDGERLKIVRQLRKLTKGKKGPPTTQAEAHDRAMRTVLRSNLARTKAQLAGAMSAPGFILVGDLF